MPASVKAAPPILIGGAQIQLQNVQLRDDTLLDEVTLDGGDVRLELPQPGEEARISTGETRVRIVMSEPNLNRLLAANVPSETPLRNLQVSLMSGRARLSGQFIRLITLPFSVEAVPRIENGARVTLDFQTANLGIGMPKAVVEILQQIINERLNLDLTALPFPVWLDELRCEPGRLTAIGRARLVLPAASSAPVSPFSARQLPSLSPPLLSSEKALPVIEAIPVQDGTAGSVPRLP